MGSKQGRQDLEPYHKTTMGLVRQLAGVEVC